MLDVEEIEMSCPYCAAVISMLIDPSVEAQQYIEDCEVCCRPIVVRCTVQEDGQLNVHAQREDD